MAHTTPLQSPSPVYLLELSIENLRCFGPRQSLDLSDGDGRPARWTVILGDNGTGKTTLLQVIADLTFLDRKVAPFLDSCLANSLMELALQGDSLSENQDVTL